MDKIASLEQIRSSINNLSVNSDVRDIAEKNSGGEFIDDLKSVLDKVSEDQLSAQRIAQSYEIGEESSIAKVMVAQQVSSLGFNMVLNVRNKVLSAYRDIINMPV
ncbi:MAG: flagellar hook-basal body complex protein FliE [Rhodospirillaceae bacterium]|jgi:flagellar hook-basal body complex protein FliE